MERSFISKVLLKVEIKIKLKSVFRQQRHPNVFSTVVFDRNLAGSAGGLYIFDMVEATKALLLLSSAT